ncbi:myoD family inhibitor [Thunnus albacares]|uniref:myoD family inhibitor n=1 Tax=Thunnus albacares TaxID=8236 RepID=UPI001CF61C92|nr:myoD family inhibitor [Thunnus albacares]
MDVTSHSESGANNSSKQSECISSQPTANGILPHHNTEEAPPPLSDRPEDADNGDDSLTSSSSTNDISCLLPAHPASATPLQKQKDTDRSSPSPPPICTPPSSSLTCPPLPPPPPPPDGSSRHSCSLPPSHHHPHHNHHHQQNTNQKRLSSAKSHTSFKAGAAQIEEVAGDDCCVHCLLGCLFCELLSMCSAVGSCLVCGGDVAGCCDTVDGCGCCCCLEAAGDVACTEEACQAVLECGILEDSSDCLEICLECCSICFPT